MREVPCPACDGARLKPLSLAVTIDGRNIHEMSRMSIGEAPRLLGRLELSERRPLIAERVLKEINARLGFLLDVGLDYLSLHRSSATLAGGEAQRIRLASQIGSGLVGVLYVLDEPSIGLHQRDNHRLIETLERLRDLGNTVLVVEHDEDTIRVGRLRRRHRSRRRRARRRRRPRRAGQGPAAEQGRRSPASTCRASGRSRCPSCGASRARQWLSVKGAREHNLAGHRRRLPARLLRRRHRRVGLGQVHAGQRHPAAVADAARSTGRRRRPACTSGSTGIEQLDKVIDIDQSPIGRTPRSNPATYTGVFDHIRKLFAQTPEAKVRGYLPGRFSFNVKGGRCEACAGDGTIKIEMHFLPDVYVPCEVCKGARYNRDTLDIDVQGQEHRRGARHAVRGGARVLRQPAGHRPAHADAGRRRPRLRAPRPARAPRCRAARPSGSSWRPSWPSARPATPSTCSTSRPPACTSRTSASCSRCSAALVDQGNTVLVIEHNLDVIKTADWIIDLGPEGGTGGGQVVVEGPPELVAKTPESYTGQFLSDALSCSLTRTRHDVAPVPKLGPRSALAAQRQPVQSEFRRTLDGTSVRNDTRSRTVPSSARSGV